MRFALLTALSIVAIAYGAHAQVVPPNAPPIARAVGALIRSDTAVYGTALSLGNGYFLSTMDAFAREQPQVRRILVQHPAGVESRLIGRLVRKDDASRLALLHLRPQPGFSVPVDRIDLRNRAEATVGEPVRVLGVPYRVFGTPDADKPLYALVPGKIVSIRRQKDGPSLIEIEAPLHEAFWGAAVLDEHNRVIGVVNSAIKPEKTFAAVPVERVRAFLAEATFAFKPPALTGTDRTVPITVGGSAGHYLPDSPPLDFAFFISLADGSKRELPVTSKSGGAFEIPVPSLPIIRAPKILTVVQTAGGSASTFKTMDHQITVAGKSVLLSRVKEIDSRREPVTTLTDGTKLVGPVSGLNRMETNANGVAALLDLGKAELLWITNAEQELAPINFRLIATLEGKQVGELAGVIPIGPPAAQAPVFTAAAQQALALLSADATTVTGSAIGIGRGAFLTVRSLLGSRPLPVRIVAAAPGHGALLPPITVMREDPQTGLALVMPSLKPADIMSGTVEIAPESPIAAPLAVHVIGAAPGMDMLREVERRSPPPVLEGSITSVHKTNGVVDQLLIAGSFHAASAGAAVLDSSDRLIAILDKLQPDGKHFAAIPLNQIRAFLAKPDISFVPVVLRATQNTEPAIWYCSVISYLSGQADSTVTLTLTLADGTNRRMPGRAHGGGIFEIDLPILPLFPGPNNQPAPVAYTLTVEQNARKVAEQTGMISIRR